MGDSFFLCLPHCTALSIHTPQTLRSITSHFRFSLSIPSPLSGIPSLIQSFYCRSWCVPHCTAPPRHILLTCGPQTRQDSLITGRHISNIPSAPAARQGFNLFMYLSARLTQPSPRGKPCTCLILHSFDFSSRSYDVD